MKLVFQNFYKKPINLIVLFFGIVYCSVSLVNHYNFRTYAFDLGLFNNELFDNAHFRHNDYILNNENFSNPLADHFSLVTPIVSPLFWIFKSYTMLIVQIAALLFGGYGVYFYFNNKQPDNKWLPEAAAIHFFLMWGIYSALGYDYHDNIVAACLVPWFIYFFEQNRKIPALLFLGAILITKENMALWAIFICLGLAIAHFKEKLLFTRGLLFSLIACLYFVLVVKIIMPHMGDLHPERGYYHFKYSALGNNAGEAFKTIVIRPLHFLKLFFINHLNDSEGYGIKKELYMTILLSGGFALLLRPSYLIMLVPIVAQKVLSDDIQKWGINYQYSIEFTPILTFAAFGFAASISSRPRLWAYISALLVATGLTTFYKLENRVSKWYAPLNQRFYDPDHYRCELNRYEVYDVLSSIPDKANVSASSPLVPHLASRDSIYMFPLVNNADYIMLIDGENLYPLTKVDFDNKVKEYMTSDDWEPLYAKNKIFLFHRKRPFNKSSKLSKDASLTTIDENEYSKSNEWTEDFENFPNSSREFFFSGSKSIKMDSSFIYSPGIEYPFGQITSKDHVKLKVSMQIYGLTNVKENPGSLVVCFEHNGQSYGYISTDLEKINIEPRKWTEISMNYLTPEIKDKTNKLKVYYWHRGKRPVFVDQLKVEVWESRN